MSAFASDDHLVSWAELSPQQNESAGKRKNTRTRPQRWLKTAMVQAAHAAVKKKDSYLRATYLRLRSRRGGKKPILAIAATMLRAIYAEEALLHPADQVLDRSLLLGAAGSTC